MQLASPSSVNYGPYSLSALAVLMSEVGTYRGADLGLPVGGALTIHVAEMSPQTP